MEVDRQTIKPVTRELVEMREMALKIAREQGVEYSSLLLTIGVGIATEGFLTDNNGEFKMYDVPNEIGDDGIGNAVHMVNDIVGVESADFWQTCWLLGEEARTRTMEVKGK